MSLRQACTDCVKVHTVDDGFGTTWQCRHALGSEHCFMEVVRPGKCQCVCDASVKALVDAIAEKYEDERAACCEDAMHHYERMDRA